MEDQEIVKEGDYVILQKQNYTKIHKVKKSIVTIGKDEVDISEIVGQPYWTTYKMEPKANSKRSYTLKKSNYITSLSDEIIKDVTSGIDNREIIDDGSSQKLSTQEIINLRECGMSAQDIVSQLIENSKTFMNKTEYSQEKYLKKKEKKYFEYITIRKPTFRLVAEVFLRQPTKVLGLRMDTLAQLTTIAGVRSGGTYILYENGCLGLVAAALIDRIGNEGTIVHVHPGCSDHPTQAVLALNLPKQQLTQLVSVNIQKLCVYDKKEEVETNEKPVAVQLGKRKAEEAEKIGGKVRRREEETVKAMEILKERKADALIIVGKEHPSNIFKKLVWYLDISRPFVIYCPVREPLQELYVEIKQRTDVIALRLTESWLRDYQVLPDRTHPDIRISVNFSHCCRLPFLCDLVTLWKKRLASIEVGRETETMKPPALIKNLMKYFLEVGEGLKDSFRKSCKALREITGYALVLMRLDLKTIDLVPCTPLPQAGGITQGAFL